ncbi:MAG: hypothetical protein ACR2NA_12960 [Solirubrobacterales bacterium]
MSDNPAASSGSRSTGEKAKLAAFGAIAALVFVFAIGNLDQVEVSWIIGTWQTPLIVVIGLCFALGLLAGFVAGRRRG